MPTSKLAEICTRYFSPGTTYFCREHDQVIHSSAAHEQLDDGNSGKPHHRCGSYICRCRDVRGTGIVDGRVKARVRGGGRDVAGRGHVQHVTATHAKQRMHLAPTFTRRLLLRGRPVGALQPPEMALV